MDKQLIKKIENISAIKNWLRNTNDTLEVLNFDSNEKQIVKREDLFKEYEEFLSYIQNNWMFRITGSEVVFDMKIYDKHHLIKICKDIWENPEKYYGEEFESETDSYYNFLKFLWVETKDGYNEFKLADIATNENNIQEILKKYL